MTSGKIDVHVQIDGRDVLAGALHFHRRRVERSTFQYDPAFLASSDGYPLEPSLPLAAGPFQSRAETFSVFADSAPDRWGRLLLDRRERQLAREEGRSQRTLGEVDYVLGVSDDTRQGALRYRSDSEDFLAQHNHGVPTLVSLPHLLDAVDRVTDNDDASLKDLLDAGTASLGGARPKTAVRDGATLLIAKFPHRGDEWDVMAWEKTALDLAEQAGVIVPRRRLERVGERHVLLLDRFDRVGSQRLGYMSARTLLETPSDHADYSDIAEALETVSIQTTADLHELWRRILYSIRINNTDDHLRNHGLIRTGHGWRLSPVFDINPNPDIAKARVTSILGETRSDTQLEALNDLSKAFRLNPTQQKAITEDVDRALKSWVQTARSNGLTTSEIDRMQDAFTH